MAKDSSTELAVPMQEQLQQAYNVIMGTEEAPRFADPEALSLAILQRIMEAETFEQAFTAQKLVPWRELLELPVFVQDVKFNRSTFESGEGSASSPLYAVVDLTRADDGEPVTVTCGGRNVLVQLIRGMQKGWLQDKPVKMIEKPTSEGFKVLWLEAA